MGRYLKILLPVIIIIVGVIIARQLLVHSPKAQRSPVVTLPPQVRTLQVQPQQVRIPVYSQGTVIPAVSSNLSAEVTGRIIETSSQFANGAFFNKGDVLVRINPSDYQLAITKAEALVASALQQLARAEAEYKQKLEEYKGMDPAKVSDYALRKPEYEEAKAKLKAAQADLNLARVQLSRCEIRAPFAGRVVEKKADVGQYVGPGTMLASVYAVDVAEVRLPLSQEQMKLLELPPVMAVPEQDASVAVLLSGQANGKLHHWQGRIVRSEASIDERNRLQYVVAQVVDPYGLTNGLTNGLTKNASQANTADSAALTTGLFVEAEIEGRQLNDIYVLPRLSIHNDDKVWLLDSQQRLRIRRVQLVHRGETQAYVSAGLQAGDTVIVSPLDAVVDGMQLRLEDTAPAPEPRKE